MRRPGSVGESSAAPAVSSQRIVTVLRDEILNGEIAPGSWLRQDEIAMRLGVSRLPVRDALRALEVERNRRLYLGRPSRLTMSLRGALMPLAERGAAGGDER